MSAHLHPLATVRPGGRPWRAVSRPVVEALTAMLRLMRTRDDLLRLDDHLLRDIGVTRAEALHEAAKAPWER